MANTNSISPSFVSEVQNSARNTKQDGYASVYFDGTGDALSVPSNAALQMGSSDFTFEAWVFLTALPAASGFYLIASKGRTAESTGEYGFGFYNNAGSYSVALLESTTGTGIFNTRLSTAFALTTNTWYHIAATRTGTTASFWVNGAASGTATCSATFFTGAGSLGVGSTYDGTTYNLFGYVSNLRIIKGSRLYTAAFTPSYTPLTNVTNTSLLTCQSDVPEDNSTNSFTVTALGDAKVSNFNPFPNIQPFLDEGVNSGQLFSGAGGVVSTYSLVYTTTSAYSGGVLAPNGEIHFVPFSANRGQKITSAGVVTTYSLVYTTTNAYSGGVLAPNGEIHFVPRDAARGQKISASGVVTTYSLVYTTAAAYAGGILAPNGEIHFIPFVANRGQKITSAGVVTTYSLLYTITSGSYGGGVLAPNGDIHFIPYNASVGQKITSAGVVTTYSLVYTTTNAYTGGVLAPNGDIHFVPSLNVGTIGQKISSTGVVSTYSLVTSGYSNGVLAPNGDIHFLPFSGTVGQKISSAGVVSTYSLVYTTTSAYQGGILAPNGDIHLVPLSGTRGQKISLNSGVFFSKGLCLSPFFNKF